MVYQDNIRFRSANIHKDTLLDDIMLSMREEFELFDISHYRLIRVNQDGEGLPISFLFLFLLFSDNLPLLRPVSVFPDLQGTAQAESPSDHFFFLQKTKQVFSIFFDDSSFEIIVCGPNLTVADICAHKPLISRLDDPTEANLFERIPGRRGSFLLSSFQYPILIIAFPLFTQSLAWIWKLPWFLILSIKRRPNSIFAALPPELTPPFTHCKRNRL